MLLEISIIPQTSEELFYFVTKRIPYLCGFWRFANDYWGFLIRKEDFIMLRINICQFAEIMERNGSEYTPVEPETVQAEEKEQGQEEKTEGTLELKTRFGNTQNVTLEVNAYVDNNSLYVGLTAMPYGVPEYYGDMTVNLLESVPPYCAFVDTNNMPELEDFLVKNGIAEFTGLMQKSGYCSYPLYLFDVEKMRKLCPDGMAAYEKKNGLDKKPEKKEKSR